MHTPKPTFLIAYSLKFVEACGNNNTPPVPPKVIGQIVGHLNLSPITCPDMKGTLENRPWPVD